MAAIENLICFSTTMHDASSIEPDDVDEFLAALYHLYDLNLAGSASPMWFYSWFDTQAGQLRVSTAPSKIAEELPFECRLNIVDTPTQVSRAFLSCDTLDGIPLPVEADKVDSTDDPDGSTTDEFVLTVFARKLT